MNKSLRYLILSASIAAIAQAAPFMAVGDGAELFVTGVLNVRADDNIFLAQNEENDLIFDITPGLELSFGKDAQAQGSLAVSDTFSNYADNSALNTNLFNADFVTKFDDGKMKLGFNAGYHELNQNSVDVRAVNGRLIRRDITSAGANAEVGVSDITSVGAAVTYSNEDYHPTGFVDSETLSIPVNFYYKWTPKLDLSLGYTYSDYNPEALAEASTDHFFNIGARGEFTPKLTGKLAVGYTQRKFDRGGDRSLLGLDASFAAELTPKTSLQFGASNMFGTSPTGAQQKNLTGNALVTTKLTEEWSVNAGISYRRIRYDTRSDDYWEGTLGAAYVVSANVRIVGAYVYRTYQADIASSEFTNNVFSIAANFRY